MNKELKEHTKSRCMDCGMRCKDNTWHPLEACELYREVLKRSTPETAQRIVSQKFDGYVSRGEVIRNV